MLAGVREKLLESAGFPSFPPIPAMGWALGRLPLLGNFICKMERMVPQTCPGGAKYSAPKLLQKMQEARARVPAGSPCTVTFTEF